MAERVRFHLELREELHSGRLGEKSKQGGHQKEAGMRDLLEADVVPRSWQGGFFRKWKPRELER